jgi:hypothetical protein
MYRKLNRHPDSMPLYIRAGLGSDVGHKTYGTIIMTFLSVPDRANEYVAASQSSSLLVYQESLPEFFFFGGGSSKNLSCRTQTLRTFIFVRWEFALNQFAAVGL